MNGKHFVVATAGHVDHGKSALVKALTGTDPDRLPEEKLREITIDLGFAHLELPPRENDMDGCGTFSVSVVDVPGHEDFVRNMIAGLGSIDLALLIVAADDGWMPQTEEHFQILNYLRVPKLVVALNKSDLVDPGRTMEQIKQKLQGTAYSHSPIVPISARSGFGIDHLKQTLRIMLEDAQSQPDIGKPRLFIDRAFTLPGIGAVVTGTLSGGAIASGQTAYLQPGDFSSRVRSVQSHRAQVDAAQPGMRTGVNLSDIPKNITELSELRGSVLTTERFDPSTVINVAVEKSGRPEESAPSRPLKSGITVYLHHGTSRVPGIVILAGNDALQHGQTGIAQLRLARPILAFVGDRFVIRDRSEQHTIAGGIILDINAPTRSFGTSAQQQSLGIRAANVGDVALYVQSELVRRGATNVSVLLRNSRFSAIEIDDAVSELHKSGRVTLLREIVAETGSWESARTRAAQLIDAAHKTSSAQKGLELSELRAAFPQLSSEIMDTLVEDLCANGFEQRGPMIARQSHRPTLPPELEHAAKQILKLLTDKLLDPPARTQVAPNSNSRKAARFLIEHGEVIEVGPDLLLSREGFDRGKLIISSCLRAKESATVSELREALGTSRRVAVPLLERLDRDRFTRRIGDRRVLAQTVPAKDASLSQ